MLGDVSQRVAAMMKDDDVADFLARCIQRVVPKSYAQVQRVPPFQPAPSGLLRGPPSSNNP